jgi:hypothetical protein
MALSRIKMIRKIHKTRVTISSVATGATSSNAVTEDHDITSLGILDIDKCEVKRQMTYPEYMTVELVNTTTIRSHTKEPSHIYEADVQIIEYY